MLLIVNADDFGYSKGVNLGIVEAYQNGIVSSATIMAGMGGFSHAAELAKDNPGLGIGAHLTLTCGRSVGGVYKTITDGEGNFLSLGELNERLGEIDLLEVEREYEAQLQKILDAGIKPDHLDSHHHTHLLSGIFGVFLKLAQRYGLGVRLYNRDGLGDYAGLKSPGAFADTFYGDTATIDHFKELVDENKARGAVSLEIMCHPAYVDNAIFRGSSYNKQRAGELEILTSGELRNFLTESGVRLCRYADLA